MGLVHTVAMIAPARDTEDGAPAGNPDRSNLSETGSHIDYSGHMVQKSSRHSPARRKDRICAFDQYSAKARALAVRRTRA